MILKDNNSTHNRLVEGSSPSGPTIFYWSIPKTFGYIYQLIHPVKHFLSAASKYRYQWPVPGSPLNGPTISSVIQPP